MYFLVDEQEEEKKMGKSGKSSEIWPKETESREVIFFFRL